MNMKDSAGFDKPQFELNLCKIGTSNSHKLMPISRRDFIYIHICYTQANTNTTYALWYTYHFDLLTGKGKLSGSKK